MNDPDEVRRAERAQGSRDCTDVDGGSRSPGRGRPCVSRRRYLAAVGAGVAALATGPTQSAAQATDVARSEKRGYVGWDPARQAALGAGWAYNYMPTAEGAVGADSQFVPMINGDDLGWTAGASDRILESEYDAQYVLGYNEPQHEEGYDDVETILYPHWQTLTEKFRDTDVRIVSPSIKVGTERGRTYFDEFVSAVESDDSLHVDDLAVHWYAGAEGMRNDPETRAQWFLDRIEWVYENYGQRPIWITEFGGPNFDGGDAAALADANVTFLERTIPELERRDYVRGYAWWEGSDATWLTEEVDGEIRLTDVGEAYVGASGESGPDRLPEADLPSTEIVPEGQYRLVNVGSGHVLEVADGATSAGADVQQGTDADDPHQRWNLRYDGEGRYELRAVHSGASAVVEDGVTDNGANVRQGPGDGQGQRWYLDPVDGDQYRVVAAHSGLVLDVFDEATEPGATVGQWQWHGGDNQRWRLEAVEDEGEGPPAIGDNASQPRDSNDDGLYEDVDGDGDTTHDDVTLFFEHLEDDTVENNAEAFDFDENGRIGFGDVIDLLRRI